MLEATFVDPGDFDALGAAKAEPAALILEPIQGEGGCATPPRFLRAAREQGHRHDPDPRRGPVRRRTHGTFLAAEA